MPSNKTTFDLYSIDPADRNEIATGIWMESAENSMAGQLFGAGEEVDSLDGGFPYIPSKTTLLRDNAHSSSRVAIGAEPNKTRGDFQSKPYEFTHKYALEGSVLKAQVFNLKKINSSEMLLDFILRMNTETIAFDIDNDLKPVLTSTVENVEVAATAPWTDDANARPMTDIEAGYDKAAGEIDTIIMGENKLRQLTKLDAFKVYLLNYNNAATSAADARAFRKQVLGFLFEELTSIQNIIIGSTWYDSNGGAQALAPARLFDDVLWMGRRDHIKMLKVSELDEGDQGYNKRTQKFWAFQNIHAQFLRLEREMGIVITGA